jgi:prepilin-type N-terminal cleavage/methylation domain-containing protein
MSDTTWYMSRPRSRHGVTLIELLVVIAIMTVMAGVVGVAAPPIRDADPDIATTRVLAARRTALSSGQSVSITVTARNRQYAVTAYADGAIVADSALGIDRLTGAAGQATAAPSPRKP